MTIAETCTNLSGVAISFISMTGFPLTKLNLVKLAAVIRFLHESVKWAKIKYIFLASSVCNSPMVTGGES